MSRGNGALSAAGTEQKASTLLLAAVDTGVLVVDCDGAAHLIDAHGQLLWIAAGDELIGVISSLLQDPRVGPAVGSKLATLLGLVRQMQASNLRLTSRERQVLRLICRGASDSSIASTLGLSPHTIRNHVASLYRKLRVKRRSDAVIWAYQRGIASDVGSLAMSATEPK